MRVIAESSRIRKLRAVAFYAAAALFLKVFFEILYEYRWYFPANFDSSFLLGRRETFAGAYRAAFYAHIVTGPLAIVLGSFLMFSGPRRRFGRLHRLAGKTQMLIVLGVVVPSGLVMAMQAYTGAIATAGFALHSIATGASAVAAVWYVRKRNFPTHQRWATRCFILLCAPLLLRVVSGATIVMKVDTDLTYQLTVWSCWIIPLAIYETWWRCSVPRTTPPRHSTAAHSTRRAFQ